MWGAELPSKAALAAWLERVEAIDPQIASQPWDDTVVATFRHDGVWIEACWQAEATLDALFTAVLAAETTGHEHLMSAWTVTTAVPLRTGGALARWRDRLAIYPDRLQQRVIEANIGVFQLAHAMAGRWTYCRRGQHLALTERLLWSTYNVLRLLFALNRRWEPDWKWLRQVTADLDRAPERLADRVELAFTSPDPWERVRVNHELIRDTLALLPPSPGVERAQRVIRATLEEQP